MKRWQQQIEEEGEGRLAEGEKASPEDYVWNLPRIYFLKHSEIYDIDGVTSSSPVVEVGRGRLDDNITLGYLT